MSRQHERSPRAPGRGRGAPCGGLRHPLSYDFSAKRRRVGEEEGSPEGARGAHGEKRRSQRPESEATPGARHAATAGPAGRAAGPSGTSDDESELSMVVWLCGTWGTRGQSGSPGSHRSGVQPLERNGEESGRATGGPCGLS